MEAGQIRQWLREDRLEDTEDSAIFLNCESCGSPIRSGRFCEKCQASVAKDLKEVINAGRPAAPKPAHKKDEEGPKMRFL